MQKILNVEKNYKSLDLYLQELKINSIFLVCGPSIRYLGLYKYFKTLYERLGVLVTRFSDFHPNPKYSEIVLGVEKFIISKSDMIIAVGGGSAIDVAKCIKLYSNMDPNKNYLEQKIMPNDIPLLAIPTTAGTGSEATRFAVVYDKGKKQSIMDESCIPQTVLMDESVLDTLPIYQRKSTMMDALSQAIESIWSINSTLESKLYAKEAIGLILKNREGYLNNTKEGNKNMLWAAYRAGQALNISESTAAHAMSYKITGLFGIAHGHAVALCLSKLWPYMLENIEDCQDSRGKEYLKDTFKYISECMFVETIEEAIQVYDMILKELDIGKPECVSEEEFNILTQSVDEVRLKNNPIKLNTQAIYDLYHKILK